MQPETSPRPRGKISLVLFLVALLIYSILLPKTMRRWQLTADEPHYVRIAQSLALDHDLDLSNNYEHGPIDPHIIRAADGTWRPAHGIGLPLLLSVPYAMGREYGVHLLLIVLSALVSSNVYLLAFELTGDQMLCVLAWLVVAFTPPVLIYSYLVYPEMPGALLLVWSLRQIVRRKVPTWRWALVGLSAAALPWLVIRFAPLSVFLSCSSIVAIGYARRADRRAQFRAIGLLLLPQLISAALHLTYTRLSFGSFSPLGMYQQTGGGELSLENWNVIRSLLGWLLDQRVGLLWFSPIYVLAFGGLAMAWAKGKWGHRLVVAAVVWHFLSTIAPAGFWVQWSPPTRYLVVVIPLMAVGVAYALTHVRKLAFSLLGLALAMVSIANADSVIGNQSLAYSAPFNRSSLFAHYGRQVSLDIARYLPLFDAESIIKFAEPLAEDGGVVYYPGFLRGFSVRRGAIVADPLAKIGRAAQAIVGETSPGEWLVGEAESEAQSGIFYLRTRLRLLPSTDDEYQPRDPVIRVSVLGEKDARLLFQKTYAVADVGAVGNYEILEEQFENTEDQILGFRVEYPGSVSVGLDYVAFQPKTGWWSSWGLALFWSATIIVITAWVFVARDPCLASTCQADRTPIRCARLPLFLLASLAIGSVILGALRVRPGHYQAEDLPRRTGTVHFDLAASWFGAVRGRTRDWPGALIYGPYEIVGGGDYIVDYRLKINAPYPRGTLVCKLDVASPSRPLALVARELYVEDFARVGRYQSFELPLSLSQSTILEFRTWHLGGADISVDAVVVTPSSERDGTTDQR